MSAAEYQAIQTGKREWRAQVWHAGKRHGIGYRDNQHDALKAASRVWCSLQGDWSNEYDTRPWRDLYGTDFLPEAFTNDPDTAEPIITGRFGDIRERGGWLVVRFHGFAPTTLRVIESQLEREWRGSMEWRGGHLFASGIGRSFARAMGALIGAPLKESANPTEEMPELAPKPLGTKGLHADKIGTRYPSMGFRPVRVKPADSKGVVCEHCGSEMYRTRRGRFCSDRCRKAASRVAA